MPLKTILFLLSFVVACGASPFVPLVGVLAYIGHYCVGADRQWWTIPLRHLGIRYSLTLAVATAVGIFHRRHSLGYGRPLLVRQEKLMLLLLLLVWLLVIIGEPTKGRYSVIDHPAAKLTKVVIFVMMMTHVVTTQRNLNLLLWVLVLGALVLGLQAYSTPQRAFVLGRLDSVGSPDFSNTNGLAIYLVAMLPLIVVQFLRAKVLGRLLCLLAGAFSTNAIILTRSRAGMVAAAGAGVLGLVLAPKRYRVGVFLGLIVAGICAYRLMDTGFLERSRRISMSQAETDPATTARLEIWSGSVKMLLDNPLGVGPGNFHQAIGDYAPKHAMRDAHNTFIRCYGELGLPGLVLFLGLWGNALFTLRRVTRRASKLPRTQGAALTLACYGIAISLSAVLIGGLTSTMLYTEFLWWLLALPVCLSRAMENLKVDRPRLTVTEATKTAGGTGNSEIADRVLSRQSTVVRW